MGQALPGVADAAVDLDGGLAHGAGGAGAVRLRQRGGGQRLPRRQRVDRPGGVQRDGVRPLGRHVRVRQQVLHGLERTDRRAVLPALAGVVDRQPHGAPHDADEVGAREREPERPPPGHAVVGERADRHLLGRPVDERRRAGQVDALLGRSEGHPQQLPTVEQQRPLGAGCVDRSHAVGRDGLGCDRRRHGRQAPQLGRQRRPEERGVGQTTRQLLGDDRRLHARGERRAIVLGGAQLTPTGRGDGGVELRRPLGVVELPDRARPQRVDDLRDRVP